MSVDRLTASLPGIDARRSARTTWQTALREAVRDPEELCRLLELPAECVEPARAAARQFGLLAPRGFVRRMRRGDPHDPLLRQVLPLAAELKEVAGYTADPLGELPRRDAAGLIRKYRSRALLVLTGGCAVHCRYCFRRHFPYAEGPHKLNDWEPALAELAADARLDEVILSGGDPLVLADATLAALAERLAAIPHLKRLRVHSRLPIVLPERVTRSLVGWLRGTRLTPVMVVHANHPAELDVSTTRSLGRLVNAGIPVLNQAVLLAGVNDDEETLAELSRRLVDARVMPYYLHQLDAVAGAAHFHVSVERGRELMKGLRRRLPGYALPRYVHESVGAEHKLPLE